jgi:RNA polymerase sigma-70 factor (ECF subfamily)
MTTTNQVSIDESRQKQAALKSLHDQSTERDLVAAAQAGVHDAMHELLVRHRTALYRAARRFTRCHEDAEDLVQEAMLRAFVNVSKFRNESHFGTWLIAIVNNAAISMKRKGRNVYFFSIDNNNEVRSAPSTWDIPDDCATPEQELMQQELVTILQTVLVRQSPTHQAVLQQCIFNEARIGDAASVLGVTISSAKSSLHRAKRRIFDSFERRGLVKRRVLHPPTR